MKKPNCFRTEGELRKVISSSIMRELKHEKLVRKEKCQGPIPAFKDLESIMSIGTKSHTNCSSFFFILKKLRVLKSWRQ